MTARKKILFLCIGNSCRSQMAEGFARAYGSDVMEPKSAGLMPATMIAPLTFKVMEEKNIQLNGQFPKGIDELGSGAFDLIVNMSGTRLPALGSPVEEWTVRDPMGDKEPVYREVANQIEGLVMRLILGLRKGSRKI